MADTRLLPTSIDDDRSRAVLEILDRLDAIDLAPLLVYRIDSVPASALYALAWQFGISGTPGWELAESDAQRRTTLKRAVALQRIRGTKAAIERAFDNVGYNDAQVDESAGAAFEFAVDLGVLQDFAVIPAEKRALLEALVASWQNARSHFLGINASLGAVTEQLDPLQEEPMDIQQTKVLLYNGVWEYDGTTSYSGTETHSVGSV